MLEAVPGSMADAGRRIALPAVTPAAPPSRPILVVKLGGAVVEEPATLDALADDLLALQGRARVVVVHGGGIQLDAALKALGEQQVKVQGLRVTSRTAAAVVQRELDAIGAELSRQLAARGVAAVHAPSVHNRFHAVPKRVDGHDLGRVGTVTAVTTTNLWHEAADTGPGNTRPGSTRAATRPVVVPVVTPVGFDGEGPLNVNADEGAAALAAALGAQTLLLATDVDHVRDAAGRPIARLDASEARRLIDGGAASGGMVPKLTEAMRALRGGVHGVCIGRYAPASLRRLASHEDAGTLVVPDVAMRWEAVMAPNYGTPKVLLVSGKGARVRAGDGTEYLDLLAGIAVNVLGHAHPAIVDAVAQQVATLGHTSNLYANEPSLRLAERLSRLADGRRVMFQNSGTECNEAALKLLRRHAHAEGMPDAVVVAFDDSFHGRTMGAVTLTGQAKYQEHYAPLVPQIAHVPYNDPVALEAVFSQHPVAGVFFESVQGEGGVRPMSPELAATLRRLSGSHNALLVADEVQTGVGRTGRFFGFEHDGLAPHVVTLAKGLGGGLPLGAVLIDPRVASLMGPGSHGTTFGGNPVCAAAGNAVLDVIEREDLVQRALVLGDAFTTAIREEGCDAGIGARGRGLLVGVPLDAPVAPQVVERLAAAGILAGQAGKSVVRFAPPLIIDEADLLGAVQPIVDAVVEAQAVRATKSAAP